MPYERLCTLEKAKPHRNDAGQGEDISPEQALDLYYSSRTAQLLADPNTGLQLMSDKYVLEDLLAELDA